MLGSKTGDTRGALRVNVVDGKPELRGEVKRTLASLTDPALEVQESEGRSGAPSEGAAADVAIVVCDGNEESFLAGLRQQAARSPRPALFALLKERSPVPVRRAIRAGADDVLFLPLDGGEVTRALLKVSEARLSAERRETGVVCSFASVTGGVGVTSLSMNLALALRYALGKRVALVDLDLQAGGLAVMLNLEPEVSIIPLVRSNKKLDSVQLESALTKHPSGIYLLAAPRRIEEGELVTDVTVGAVLDVMRQMFDFVIVDCGGQIDENKVAAWGRSTRLFYVLRQSVVSVRCAWRFIDLLERLGLATAEPQYLLNCYAPNHAISEKHVENIFGRQIFAKIPRDEKAREQVELSGQDLWQVAANSRLAKSLEELARRVAGATGAGAQPGGGLIARLFSVFGARS